MVSFVTEFILVHIQPGSGVQMGSPRQFPPSQLSAWFNLLGEKIMFHREIWLGVKGCLLKNGKFNFRLCKISKEKYKWPLGFVWWFGVFLLLFGWGFFNQERLTSEHCWRVFWVTEEAQAVHQKSSAFAIHDCCKRTDVFVLMDTINSRSNG